MVHFINCFPQTYIYTPRHHKTKSVSKDVIHKIHLLKQKNAPPFFFNISIKIIACTIFFFKKRDAFFKLDLNTKYIYMQYIDCHNIQHKLSCTNMMFVSCTNLMKPAGGNDQHLPGQEFYLQVLSPAKLWIEAEVWFKSIQRTVQNRKAIIFQGLFRTECAVFF